LEASASTPRPAERSSASRLEPLLGIAFAVLFFAAFFIQSPPNDNASDTSWVNYYASSGHRTTILVGGFLLVFAAMCMLGFLTMIWFRIAAAQPAGSLSPLPLAAAAVASACVAIGGVLGAVVAGAMIFGNLPEPSPDILRFTGDAGFPVIGVAGMFATALAIGGLSLQARRVGFFSQRLATFSMIVAVITLASFLFFPLLVMLIWFVVVAVALYRRVPAPSPAQT
jgi:hypothetical protein